MIIFGDKGRLTMKSSHSNVIEEPKASWGILITEFSMTVMLCCVAVEFD